MINKRYLYLLAGLIWGIPGVMVAIKGIRAYCNVCTNDLWWLGLIIAAEPDKTTIWHTFPVRGWILVVCMSCLGMALKFVPFIPIEFTASFYSGLGPALVIAAIQFMKGGKLRQKS